MTARRIPVPGLVPGEQRLEGAAAHYLVRVLRLRAGDAFVGFDPATGSECDASIVWAETGFAAGVAVRFGPLREGATRNGPVSIAWVQGLAKGNKCDAVVRDATELGATRIVVALTKRSVVKLDREAGGARHARWARIAREAARQCGRSEAPLVEAALLWRDALAQVGEAEARFCLWEGATSPLAPPLFEALSRGAALAFACGPEGGLDEGEAQLARDAGWTLASLGPLTLRTETVAAAVLGAVRVWRGAFDSAEARGK
jgi:16S rRNA (uracil1498-N3)-methyltransferase